MSVLLTNQTSARRVDFNRMGPGSPVRIPFDLDSGEQQIALADVGLGHCPEPQARLHVAGRDDAAFRLSAGGATSSQVVVRATETARLEIDRKALDAAAANGLSSVTLRGSLTRRLKDRDSPAAPIEIIVELFRSGPPIPRISFTPVVELDAHSTVPEDDHVRLGRVEIAARQSGVLSTGRARITITPSIVLSGEAPPNPSFRVRRPAQDADDPVWYETGLPFMDELQLNPAEGRFDLDHIDIGLPYPIFRDWLRRRAAGPRAEQRISLRLTITISTSNDPPVVLIEQFKVHTIDVTGSLPDTMTFSGLGPTLVLPVTAQSGEIRRYMLAQIPVRPSADRAGYDVAPRALDIRYDGLGIAHLKIEYRLHMNGSDGPICSAEGIELESEQTARAPLDLAGLLGDFGEFGAEAELTCIVSVLASVKSLDGETTESRFEFDIALQLAPELTDWLACIDFGTSSTAIWVGRSDGDHNGLQLRLGQWLERIDPRHEESAWWKPRDTTPQQGISYLLPSHIGLSPQINLRADYDPLSLGDLSLSAPGDNGTSARLHFLDRSYDVSVPFPSRDLMAEHIDTIVTEPKRRMIGRADHVRLNADVAIRDAQDGTVSQTRRVDLARLFEDCFAELGGYIAHCALSLDLDQSTDVHAARADGRRALADLTEQARLDAKSTIGLIVTHPSGIDRKREQIYRKAGQRFLDGFRSTPKTARAADVRLVGEALAAARFGVQNYLDRSKIQASGEKRTFVTLDIGAGTYDVTVIETTLSQQGPTEWAVRSHFGLAIGGYDLDRELAGRIGSILRAAATTSEISRIFQIETELPQATADMWRMDQAQRQVGRQFLLEMHAAKARLTERLLGAADGDFGWPGRAQGGVAFDMRVGLPGSDDTWPVRLKTSAPATFTSMLFAIPGTGAEIGVERDAAGASIRLRLWRDAFESPGEGGGGRLDAVLRLMGVELPRLAWLEYQRKCADYKAQGGMPIWIVTGRAALWPQLFGTIKDTVASFGAESGSMLQSHPFAPDDMKRAVVVGAIQLAREPWTSSDDGVYNPIALITYKPSADLSSRRGAARGIGNITRVVDGDGAMQATQIVEAAETFAIARIIPGLDEEDGRDARIDLFNQLGLKPWDELQREVPRPKGAGTRKIRWTIGARRDLSGLHLTFDPGAENGPPLTFGPLRERRVYGSE